MCNNFKSYYETHNKETISNEVIEASGLFRLSDILKLSNKIDFFTVDGYTCYTDINNLSLYLNQNWLVSVDNHITSLKLFDTININKIPINVSHIDSIIIITSPSIQNGIFIESGLIQIFRKKIR